jgi:Domain of unknown function (DUF4279)
MDPEISIQFSLQGNFDPEALTRRLGLRPTRTWRRGDGRTAARAWEWDGWAVRAGPEHSVDLVDLTIRLVAHLEPHVDAISAACEECGLTAHLDLIALTTDTMPTVHFEPHIVSVLARLGVELDVDVWLLGDNEDEQVVTFDRDVERPSD